MNDFAKHIDQIYSYYIVMYMYSVKVFAISATFQAVTFMVKYSTSVNIFGVCNIFSYAMK